MSEGRTNADHPVGCRGSVAGTDATQTEADIMPWRLTLQPDVILASFKRHPLRERHMANNKADSRWHSLCKIKINIYRWIVFCE